MQTNTLWETQRDYGVLLHVNLFAILVMFGLPVFAVILGNWFPSLSPSIVQRTQGYNHWKTGKRTSHFQLCSEPREGGDGYIVRHYVCVCLLHFPRERSWHWHTVPYTWARERDGFTLSVCASFPNFLSSSLMMLALAVWPTLCMALHVLCQYILHACSQGDRHTLTRQTLKVLSVWQCVLGCIYSERHTKARRHIS